MRPGVVIRMIWLWLTLFYVGYIGVMIWWDWDETNELDDLRRTTRKGDYAEWRAAYEEDLKLWMDKDMWVD